MRYLKRAILLGLTFAALTVAPSTEASASYANYYIDALTLGNAMESQGISYQYRHVAVDNALCLGLRRYGVHSADYQDTFWRFRCTVNGANGHFYDVQVSTTGGPRSGYWYWHALSAKLMF